MPIDCAFYGCSSLTSVTFGGTKEQWLNIGVGKDVADGSVTIECSDGELQF